MAAALDRAGVRLSIVVPLYNEAEVVERFHDQLRRVIDPLPYATTIYYVNDGSADQTGAVVQRLAAADARIAYVELSRNFGHQAALTAGLDLADGEAVITMDGDGQHPPELIPQLLKLHQAGCDIVLTQRLPDAGEAAFKRRTSRWFYSFVNRVGDTRILPGTADYRLMSRQAVEALKQMREYHRFLRGMIPWMGYQVAVLPYVAPRRLGGQSKYSLRKMLKLAADAIFSFSLVPLRVGISLGLLFFAFALLEMIYVLSLWTQGAQSSLAPGWSSLMFVMLFIGGVQLIIIGFIGVYVGYIFQEVKRRPLYLLKTFQAGPAPATEPASGPEQATSFEMD
jgi:dolichol-phosphate mannosyltransferase